MKNVSYVIPLYLKYYDVIDVPFTFATIAATTTEVRGKWRRTQISDFFLVFIHKRNKRRCSLLRLSIRLSNKCILCMQEIDNNVVLIADIKVIYVV